MVDASLISEGDIAAGLDLGAAGSVVDESERPSLARLREDLEADRAALAPVADALTAESLAAILTALSDAAIALPSSVVDGLPPEEVDGHVWVRVLGDDGVESDLRPTIADASPGDPISTIGPEYEGIPEALRHRVDIRVVAETLLGGLLTQDVVLELSEYAHVLADRGLMFAHVPAETVGDVALFGGIRRRVALQPGGVPWVRSVCRPAGPVDRWLRRRRRPLRRRPVWRGRRACRGGSVRRVARGRAASPGSEPALARRPIFDRVGEAVRAGGALDPYAVPPAELLDLGDGGGTWYLPMRALRVFHIAPAPTNVKALISGYAMSYGMPESLLAGGLHVERALLGVDLAAGHGYRPIQATPGVISWDVDLTPEGAVLGWDIWHRSTGERRHGVKDLDRRPSARRGCLRALGRACRDR